VNIRPLRIAATPRADEATPLVRVENVTKHFPIGRGLFGGQVVRAVDGVSFAIRTGETLGLVGESGCGKSTLGRVIVQLQPATAGHVFFEDTDLVSLRGERLRRMRRQMQMVFQDPYSSLNPRMTVGDLVSEPLTNFGMARSRDRQRRVTDILRLCGLSASAVGRYPHEFSAGQRQRIGIARALVLNPRFVVADEPLSALDVSVQAQIVNLLEDLRSRLQLTYLFITHDLAVVRHVSDRVAVMYLGRLVEVARTADLFARPLHPYTTALLSAIRVPDPDLQARRRPILLKGELPSPMRPPSGCRFHTRCPIARFPICAEREPALEQRRGDRAVACHFPGKL